eukprot:gb/GFBE01047951.1/.p1 GENE.gb/GFBE01047951.1/~~gb/GFBE01047951.1/.p1  ORF type:complete len:292 (+),score=51.31 gb/GFBE01047951.1/:1-876(+)
MAAAIGMVGARPTNAVTDFLLSLELSALLILWLREWPAAGWRKQALFVSYGLNLLGAAGWCSVGVYVHVWQPLPQEPTVAWQLFLLLGASTPLLFPLVIRDAFYRSMVSSSVCFCQDILVGFAALTYALLVNSGIDLAAGQKLPAVPVSPWHSIDGRSYAGEEHGIHFDLLSVMPSARLDSNFVLSSFFFVSNGFCTLLLVYAYYRLEELADHNGTGGKQVTRPAAGQLAVGVGLMFANCHLLAVLIAGRIVTVAASLDIFHVVQGLIIWRSFFQFRSVLREDAANASKSA